MASFNDGRKSKASESVILAFKIKLLLIVIKVFTIVAYFMRKVAKVFTKDCKKM